MRPQVFEWLGDRFEQLPSQQLGPWSESKVVGRAVARLDWNGDGAPDLVVGLLEGASFVLTNTSTTKDNRHVSLRLVATNSARDAVGATITTEIGSHRHIHQLTAGDGYQCSNERQIQLGCGEAETIDRLRIDWPSGLSQEFTRVKTSRSFVAVEGRELKSTE